MNINESQNTPQNWSGRFFTIWSGQALSLFGSALVQFALIWWLTQKSGSATVLAVATLVGFGVLLATAASFRRTAAG